MTKHPVWIACLVLALGLAGPLPARGDDGLGRTRDGREIEAGAAETGTPQPAAPDSILGMGDGVAPPAAPAPTPAPPDLDAPPVEGAWIDPETPAEPMVDAPPPAETGPTDGLE